MLKDTLKQLREQHKLTKKQAAEGIGMSERAYIAYEYGERDVSTDQLSRIADFYHVTTDYLLGREPLPDPFADLGLDEETEKDVIEKYMSFPPEIRAATLDVLRQLGAVFKDDEPKEVMDESGE